MEDPSAEDVEAVEEEDVDVAPTVMSGPWAEEEDSALVPLRRAVDGVLEADRATVDLLGLEDPDSSLPLVEEDRTRP